MSEAHDPTHATVVVLGGEGPWRCPPLPAGATVVAADSGAATAVALGLTPDRIVGDLDSLDPGLLERLRQAGTVVERHHPDKDATDGALAVASAVASDPDHLVVLGGHGGRVDHALAVLSGLAELARPGRRVEAWMGEAQLVAVADRAELSVRVGELVSLLAVNGDAHGVGTEGLRWPLSGAHLAAGSTLGLSNEALTDRVAVTVERGRLLAVRPHALGDPTRDRRPVPPRPGGPA